MSKDIVSTYTMGVGLHELFGLYTNAVILDDDLLIKQYNGANNPGRFASHEPGDKTPLNRDGGMLKTK